MRKSGPTIRKNRVRKQQGRSQPRRLPSASDTGAASPSDASPTRNSEDAAAPVSTSRPGASSSFDPSSSFAPSSEPPPDLPDITLSPTPLSRSPLAAVYRGWDRVRRYDVFVKVQRATGDPVALSRFRREAAVMRRLRHPNIVALYHFHDGDPAALVMEYVPGPTLAALVQADGWLSPARTAAIIEGVAAALDCAHAQNIIHRDVKPANILLPRRGAARLTDFGVAHIEEDAPLTVMGDILGTIEYASPEQVRGQETPDARSDVYALAAVAYFALAATPPFRATDNSTQAQLSVMHRQVYADPPPLRFHREDLSPEVEQVVLRGLSKAPDARYQSAGQLAAALRSAVEAEAGSPEQSAMARASRRTGALAGALAGGTLLLLAAIGLPRTGYFAPHPPRPPEDSWRVPPPIVPLASHSGVGAVPRGRPSLENGRPLVPRQKGQARTEEGQARGPAPTGIVTPKTITPKMHREKMLVAQRRPDMMPPVIAKALFQPPRPKSHPASKSAAPGQAWLQVYAKQETALPGQSFRMVNIRAEAVYVDGRPYPALASGRWTALPTGKHRLSFFPDARSGFSPHAGVPITLTPGAHVSRQVLLPRMTNFSPSVIASPHSAVLPVAAHKVGWFSVSGWIAAPSPGSQPELTRSPVAWVKVDGRPVASLALGQWAELAAGRHVVTLQPEPGLGVGPKTWTIDLSPQAHLQQQVPLPAAPLPATPPHLRNP